ncbi:IFNL3 protein, partial [Pachyramphus minor]|nr:IFNL3 protein [Pachyramphus minor]
MLCLHLTPLLVLVLGVSLGAAFPHDTLRKGCSLFKYKQIMVHEKKAVEKMQKEFSHPHPHHCQVFETPLLHRWLFGSLTTHCCPQVPDRVVLVEAELNFTIMMLQLSTHPGFTKTRQRPLAFLAQAREDLRGCVSALRAPSPMPAPRPWRCRQHLGASPENTGCLQHYAIRHVLEVLDDLKCAARQEQCS